MLFMLLFNIRRLRGDKSCMLEDKKMSVQRTKFTQAQHASPRSSLLAYNDIPLFNNPVLHAKPFFLVKPAAIGHSSQQQVGCYGTFSHAVFQPPTFTLGNEGQKGVANIE